MRQFVEMKADRAFLYPVARHSYLQMSDIKLQMGRTSAQAQFLLYGVVASLNLAPVVLAEQASAAFLECRCKSSALRGLGRGGLIISRTTPPAQL